MTDVGEASLSRNYAKLCDVRDFRDDEFIDRARSIRPDLDLTWQFDRKTWESVMLSFFLEEAGLLDGERDVLSVGAGREMVMFWLAPYVKRLVGVDLYGEGEFSESEAPAEIVTEPRRFSPFPHEVSNLELRTMDARSLDAFPDASFDAVYTLSSIEHFGSPSDIKRAAAEIGRVLKPGSYAYIATELVVEPSSRSRRALEHFVAHATRYRLLRREVFTLAALQSEVITPSGLTLLQPLDLTISPESFDNLAVRRLRRLRTRQGTFHPHIVLRVRGETFTSVGLPFRKL